MIRLRDVRSQVEDLHEAHEGHATGADAIEKSGKALVDKLNALEDALVQKRVVDGQTVINFPMRLNQFYIYLRSAIDGSDAGTTDGQRERLGDLSRAVAAHQQRAARRARRRPGAFNRLVRDAQRAGGGRAVRTAQPSARPPTGVNNSAAGALIDGPSNIQAVDLCARLRRHTGRAHGRDTQSCRESAAAVAGELVMGLASRSRSRDA